MLHPAWRIGVPSVAVALAAWGLVRRPPFRYAMVVVAVLVALAAAATYVGAYLPVFELAGNISAG